MSVLGIETASEVCSVALVGNGVLMAERSMTGRQIHSEELLPMIDVLLRENNGAPANLDGIAVSIGPGSFTGLRIGLSTAKGLAFANDTPLVGVSTLEALAFGVFRAGANNAPGAVLAILDSRRGECFAGCFIERGGLLETVIPAGAYTYRELAAAIVNCRSRLSGCRVAGPGAQKFLESSEYISIPVKEPDPKLLTMLPAAQCACSAAAVALLGERQLAGGASANIADLEPDYMKDFFTTAVLHTTNL